MSKQKAKKEINLNKIQEMINYYHYYGKDSNREIKEQDLEMLSKAVTEIIKLLKDVDDYEFTTQKDAYETFKNIQEKIREKINFKIPTY